MWVILRGFHEELLAVGVVVLRRCRGGEWRFNPFRIGQLQCAVYFIGGDVVEAFALVFLREGFPVFLCSLQQRQRAHHVGACESERVLDRSVDMTLGSEMDDAVDFVLRDDAAHLVEVSDVGFDEGIVGFVLDILQIGEVAGIGKFVEVDDMVVVVFVYEQADNMASDETSTTGDENITLHFLSGF